MGKLEPYEAKRTKWEGLWWHPECNGFYSTVLDLADLRKFKGRIRMMIRKNKFFNGGENGRPNYVFSIMDAGSETFHRMEVTDTDEEETRSFTYSQIQDLINRVACEVGGSMEYGEHLVGDFLDWG